MDQLLLHLQDQLLPHLDLLRLLDLMLLLDRLRPLDQLLLNHLDQSLHLQHLPSLLQFITQKLVPVQHHLLGQLNHLLGQLHLQDRLPLPDLLHLQILFFRFLTRTSWV